MFVFSLVLWGCSTIENKPLQLKSGSAPIYSDPARVFDESARKTLSTWRFIPEMVDGLKKKSVDVISRISFQLSSESLDY